MSSINYVNNNYSKSGVIYYKGKQYFRNENPNLGTKTITENGTYSAEDDGYVGYLNVDVNVEGGGAEYYSNSGTFNINGINNNLGLEAYINE